MNETQTYKNLKNKPKDNFPEMIIVHHSGGTDANPSEDTSNHTAQIMEAFHLSKKWEGLGYQYVIHKDGAVWLGRPETYHGAHTVNFNNKSIGICLAGNFDVTLPTPLQEISLKSLILDIRGRYPNIGEKIYPHRRFAKKTCYGSRLADNWVLNLVSSPIPPTIEIKTEKEEVLDILKKAINIIEKKW